MASSSLRLLIFGVVILTSLDFGYGNGQSFGLKMHHKFSREAKRWMGMRHGVITEEWPMEGSKEYYRALYEHDYVRHGRNLIGYKSLSFLTGNESIKLSHLGFLHYSMVTIGTPSVPLFVALDTGSDLFWVPCECKQCAPTSAQSYGLDFELNIYNPSASQTSKRVDCNNSLCDLHATCSKSSQQCPYEIVYVSTNTSSSGILVEDVLYLTPGSSSKVVTAPITFGCGQRQTGSFLDGAAPDGLLGLGVESISVPSILAKLGYVPNSFSMCFQKLANETGRIIFGDKGSSDQQETPLIIDNKHPTYKVGVKEFYVGNTVVKTGFEALFDTGTSFTYLADPAYKNLAENFHMQTKDRQLKLQDDSVPFEFCYEIRDNQSINQMLQVSLSFNGGNNFSLIQPYIFFANETALAGYCLAVIQSQNLSIIGQNFMTGYQIVFDREKFKLGWKEANCYDIEASTSPESTPLGPVYSPLAPSPVADSPQKSSINSIDSYPRAVERASPPPTLSSSPNDAIHVTPYFVKLALVIFFSFMGTI